MKTDLSNLYGESISLIKDFMRWYDKDFNFESEIECESDVITSMFALDNEIVFWGKDDVYTFREMPLDTLIAICGEIQTYVFNNVG